MNHFKVEQKKRKKEKSTIGCTEILYAPVLPWFPHLADSLYPLAFLDKGFHAKEVSSFKDPLNSTAC